MAINFDLNDLFAFRAAVELGSFRKAADKVRISQPALSGRIKKLEDALGVKLFDRSGREAALTSTGRAFASSAQLVLETLDAALLSIPEVVTPHTESVSIACIPSAAYYFMPGVIAEFHKRYPRIRVKLIDSSASEIVRMVSSGEVDLGLSFALPSDADLDFRRLRDERFVVACRRDHSLSKRRRVTWAEFYKHDHISLDEQSGSRSLLDQALAAKPAPPASVCETRHVITVMGLIEAGVGVAAVPAIAMPHQDHPRLTSIPLVEPVVTRRIGLISRKGGIRTPSTDLLSGTIIAMQARQRALKAMAKIEFHSSE